MCTITIRTVHMHYNQFEYWYQPLSATFYQLSLYWQDLNCIGAPLMTTVLE